MAAVFNSRTGAAWCEHIYKRNSEAGLLDQFIEDKTVFYYGTAVGQQPNIPHASCALTVSNQKEGQDTNKRNFLYPDTTRSYPHLICNQSTKPDLAVIREQ